MLSDFIKQDKHRKYMLNDHGRLLYQSLKRGILPPTLEIKEAFTHRVGRWLFLSPVFAKTVHPVKFLPVSILILILGAAGHHMRLFLCYPYFGNQTLEHDPSLGLEEIPMLVLPQLVVILVAATAVTAVVIFVVKRKRGTVNIVGVH